jgi:GNAT superfamily N-acetyltransferase
MSDTPKKPSTIICKPVDYADVEQGKVLVQLLNGYAQDECGGGKPLEDTVQRNLPAQLAARVPQAFSFIAYYCPEEDTSAQLVPAGLINCFEGFSTFAGKPLVNVHDLYVVPEYRGKGVSRALLKTAEQEAINRKSCKVTLECLSGNAIAMKAYQKYGFTSYELDPQHGHAVFMEKKISK